MDNNLRAKYIKADGSYKSELQRCAERIRASEKIRIDITKEEDPIKMLDLSMLCISIFTGDEVWYKQNRDKLINKILEFNA